MADVIQKIISANNTVNGSAYINPNSLKIPPSTVQRVNTAAQNEDLLSVSGILNNRFDDITYYSS